MSHNSILVLKNKWLNIGLVVVVLLAFMVRIGVVFTLEMPSFSYGENSAIAVNIVEGKGYTYSFYGLRPDRPLQSFVPPLYTWIVWSCLVSSSDAAHALGVIHAILSTLSLPLIFFLSYKLSGDKVVAFLAMFCVAFYPPVILSLVRPQTLTLNIFLVALLLATSVKLYEAQNILWSIVLGLTLGIALHSRSMLAILFPILMLWFYLNGVALKKLLVIGLTIIISTIIVLIPWSVRNYSIHQQFVFMSLNGGFNLWTGNNSFTTGSGHEVYTDRAYEFMNKEVKKDEPAIQEMHRYPLPAHIAETIATIDEVELDRQLYQAGFKYIEEHPLEWLQLMWVKFKSFIWFRPNIGSRYNETWTLYYRYLYAMLLVPFVIGVYLSVPKWKKYSLLYMLFGSYAGFYTIFHVQMRFRWEIEPFFFVFVALTLIFIVELVMRSVLGFNLQDPQGSVSRCVVPSPTRLGETTDSWGRTIGQVQLAARHLASVEIWPVALLAGASVVSSKALPWAIGVAGLFWVIRYLAYGRLSVRSAVDWPVALMGLMLPVSLWVTALPAITRPAAGYVLVGIALFYAITNWAASPGRLRLLTAGLLLAGFLLALSAPLSGIQPATDKLPFVPESLYTSLPHLLPDTVHPNVMAGPLAILLPVALALLLFVWRQLSWYLQGLAGIAVLAMALVLILTQSRGGLLALGATLIGLALLRWRRGGWLLLVAVAVAAAIAFRYLGANAVIGHLTTDRTFGGVEGRVMVWSRALSMVRDFPFTGVGMGTFQPVADVLYPLYTPSREFTHAHNLPLQVAVDLGFPGLIAWLAILMLVVFAGWWLYRQGRVADDAWLSGLGAGLFCSQVALVTHGLVDAVTWGGVRPAVFTWALWGLAMASWNVYGKGGGAS